MISKDESPESNAAIAFRLRLIREAMGLKKASFARLVGISAQAWENVEGSPRKPAANRISLDLALLVCRATGVSLDYIYRGQLMDRLPANILAGIQQSMQDKARKRA